MRVYRLSIIASAFVPALGASSCEHLAEADCADWNTREFFEVATPGDVSRCLAAGSDPEARDEWGHTPLHVAAEYESPDMVRALLEAGADPDVWDVDVR